jgi:hypothetical protein
MRVLPVFSFLFFPTFTGFAKPLVKFARSRCSGLLSVLRYFMSGFTSLERYRISILQLSLALDVSVCFASVRTSSHPDGGNYH